MASTYASFLKAPSASGLAADASLSYITTTTTINEPAAILKHLQAQLKQVEKKEEKVLKATESADGLCLETQTTLQFRSGGGTYLPGIDENLLDEKTVTLPLIHVVSFNAEQKIQQIRLYWDQGTLLKQVEAIGRTGRNWPIRDGDAQIDAVNKSVKAAGASAGTSKTTGAGSRIQDEVVINQHKKRESASATATRDPHASLSLFAPRDPNEDAASRSYDGPQHATRVSAKPVAREYGDLFAHEEAAAASGSAVRSLSPSKAGGAPKAGAGKNFAKNRLFDENSPGAVLRSPERKKVYDQKYDHFAFGDGEDAPQERPTSGKGNAGRNKNESHFSFEDFSTPPKYKEKHQPEYQRNWGGETEQDDPPSPQKRPIVHAARPNTATHFEITDDTPANGAQGKAKLPGTNVDNERRGEDFGPHFSISDKSPAGAPAGAGKPAAAARADQASHWGFSTPVPEKKIYKTAGNGMGGRATNLFEQTPPTQEKKIYKTAGDGMGGRNNASRLWGIGDDSDPDVEADARSGVRGRRA